MALGKGVLVFSASPVGTAEEHPASPPSLRRWETPQSLEGMSEAGQPEKKRRVHINLISNVGLIKQEPSLLTGHS